MIKYAIVVDVDHPEFGTSLAVFNLYKWEFCSKRADCKTTVIGSGLTYEEGTRLREQVMRGV